MEIMRTRKDSKVGGWDCKCGLNFRTRKLLQEHKKLCNVNKELKPDRSYLHQKDKFICRYCNKQLYTSKSGFASHEKYCINNPQRLENIEKVYTNELRNRISEQRKSYIKAHNGIWWNSRSNCKRSYAEEWVLKILRNDVKDQNFIEEFHLGKWFMDFAWPNKKIYLEVDGEQHNWNERKKSDQEKDDFYKSLGWKVLRLPWKYVCNNTAEAIKNIIDFVDKSLIVDINWVDPNIIKKQQKQNLVCNGQVNVLGIPHSGIVSIEEWENRKNLIINSGVDLTKFGWISKVMEQTKLSKRVIYNTVIHFNLPVFKLKRAEY